MEMNARQDTAGNSGNRKIGKLKVPAFTVNPKIYEEMKRLLKGDAERAVDVLENLYGSIRNLSDEQLESYIVTVHGMKSALNYVGQTELASFALRLEQAGNSGELDIIALETLSFIDSLKDLIEDLNAQGDAPAENAPDGSAGTKEDFSELKSKLSGIKAECEVYNIGPAKALLSELKQKSWPQPAGDVLDKLGMHLLHSDFDEAVKVIDEYLSE